jgi:hypothetical protein
MAAETQSYNGLMHAGGGTVLFLLPLSAMVPGLLPFVALAGVFIAVVLIPLVALTLVAGVLAVPPAGIWLLVKRLRPAPPRVHSPVLPNPARTRS